MYRFESGSVSASSANSGSVRTSAVSAGSGSASSGSASSGSLTLELALFASSGSANSCVKDGNELRAI